MVATIVFLLKLVSIGLKRFRAQIEAFLDQQKVNLLWDGLVQSLTVAYLPQCMALAGAI